MIQVFPAARQRLVIVIGGWFLVSGCSGMSATQVGQAAGTIAGSAIAPGPGSTLGALVGTLAGMIIDRQVDKVREQKERVELGQQLGVSTPHATPAVPDGALIGQPTRVWVDERLENGRLVAGRFEVQRIP